MHLRPRPLPSLRRSFLLLGLVLCAVAGEAAVVAPHALFLRHGGPPGELTLSNSNDAAEEFEITLQFGYPVTDSAGTVSIHFEAAPSVDASSAAGWIRVSPRRGFLEPRSRQKIRLIASPPPTLTDGEYWTRLIATSRAARGSRGGTDSTVRVGASMEVRQILSVTYRKGRVTTGLQLDSLRAAPFRDSIVVRAALTRTGTGAYLGTARFELRDDAQQVVARASLPIAVYRTLDRRVLLRPDRRPLVPGRYELVTSIRTDRTDIETRHVLPAVPIEHRTTILVP